MSYVLRVKDRTLALQCAACPTAWDVETINGEVAYIRYRYGNLSVNVIRPGGIERVWEERVGGEWDGVMDQEEMRRHLAGVVEFVNADTREGSRA